MAISDLQSSIDLSNVDWQGLINEDVMQTIYDISDVALPITDRIGSGSCSHRYTSWTEDELATPKAGAGVPETYVPTDNDASSGSRIGNHCQISPKSVGVTARARNVDTIGYSDELVYQIMQRQKELRRDVEATTLSEQGSVDPATEDSVTQTAGLGAWITQGDFASDASGGGFSGGLIATRVAGTKRALSFGTVMDVIQAIWMEGGEPSLMTSHPNVTRKLIEFCLANDQQIVDMTNEVGSTGAQANRLVKTLLTEWDFAISILPNRMQQAYDSLGGTAGDAATLFLLDPAYLSLGYLQGYTTDAMGKRGLMDERLMSVDWQTQVLNRNAHGAVGDVDIAAAVVA